MLALVVGLGTWAVFGGSQGEDVAPEVSVVMSQYEAWNNGDVDAYLATFTGELAQDGIDPNGVTAVLLNANAQIEVVEPCRVIETNPVVGSTVQCSITQRDDFRGPAGITEARTDTFVVDLEGLISSVDDTSTCCDAEFEFNNRFWQWLEFAYPAVYDEIKPQDFAFDKESLPGYTQDAAHMLIAIRYVEEFVAQSPDYPISP